MCVSTIADLNLINIAARKRKTSKRMIVFSYAYSYVLKAEKVVNQSRELCSMTLAFVCVRSAKKENEAFKINSVFQSKLESFFLFLAITLQKVKKFLIQV
jgi:hypothetical protein